MPFNITIIAISENVDKKIQFFGKFGLSTPFVCRLFFSFFKTHFELLLSFMKEQVNWCINKYIIERTKWYRLIFHIFLLMRSKCITYKNINKEWHFLVNIKPQSHNGILCAAYGVFISLTILMHSQCTMDRQRRLYCVVFCYLQPINRTE